MNITTSLKTLPLVTALTMTLALAPAVSMADKEHGHHRDDYSEHQHHKNKKHHGKLARTYSHHERGYKKHHGHHHNRHYDRHYHGHPRYEEVVVYDYYRPRHYIGLDNLRFMIGLHTGNIDLIFRD